MTDEHLRWVNYYFSKIQSLQHHRQDLTCEIAKNRNLINDETFLACKRHATAQISTISSVNLQKKQENLTQRVDEISHEVQNYRDNLLSAGEFDTKKLTKYLAKVLSERTKSQWLPIRYLLEPATHYTPQVEGYAVLLADSLYALPGIPDTITLLDHKCNQIWCRSNIIYRESETDRVVYKNVDNFDNIWMFGSQNFISIGVGEKFNAFYNYNNVDKPFLHLCLNDNNVETLREISDDGSIFYENYSVQHLTEKHPRHIAVETLADLINARLDKRTAEQSVENFAQNSPEMAQSYME